VSEIGLYRYKSEYGSAGWCIDAQIVPPAGNIISDGRVMIVTRAGHEYVWPSRPGHSMRWDREVDLEWDSSLGLSFDGRLPLAIEASEVLQHATIGPFEQTLKLKLVLPEGRAVEVSFDRLPESRIGQGTREAASQAVHGSPLDGAPGVGRYQRGQGS
jgi:hypothetical protein